MCYQVFLEAIKNKAEGEELQPKLRFLSLMDGCVDFFKFEIEIYKNKKTYKVIRDANNN